MTILIQAANIAYAHGGNQLFTDLSFVLQERERIALIGENGAGKSTLFRLLAGELQPQAGAITRSRGVTVGYLTQHSRLDPDATVRQIVMCAAGNPDALEYELLELEELLGSGLSDEDMADAVERYTATLERLDVVRNADPQGEIDAILGGLRFPEHRWDQRIGTLSGGERKLVDVARFLLAQPDVLLLDEPDNHFDTDAKAWLETWLTERYPGAVCMISHDRYMIDRVATTIVELEDGRLTRYPGNYSQFVEEKRNRIEREIELRQIAEKEYLRIKAAAEELTQWARQNPKFATRAENMRRRVAEERARLDAQPVPRAWRPSITIAFQTERGSTDVISGRAVSIAFDKRTVIRPFDVLIRHGERVGVIGPNGAGKTSFVRALIGELRPATGTLKLGTSISVAHYDQMQATLDPDASPIDLVRKAKALNEQQALSALVATRFDRGDAMNAVRNLSGGEQARLQITLMMLSGANLLVLDEPTNNLDLASVERLEDALLDYDGTILTISHDRYFLNRMCTRVLALDDGIVRDYPGDSPMRGSTRTKARS